MISRDKLLVLRKTLIELIKKNWITTSSSPGDVAVLFIKQLVDSLKICIDYRALNAISERDRYPLSLIQEALRMLPQASYILKVDVRSAFHGLRFAKGAE